MAFTAQEEAILRAVMNSFVGAGFTTEDQATRALTILKLQNDVSTANAQLQNEFDNFEAVRLAYAQDLSDAQEYLELSKSNLSDFVLVNDPFGPEDVDNFAVLSMTVEQAKASLAAVEAQFVSDRETHNTAVSTLTQAVESAQESLNAFSRSD